MNIKQLNEQMRAAYHAAGYKGRGIRFAVFDTGVKPAAHLKGRVIAGTPDGLIDKDGHGTFVAGQLIEWCPEAEIVSMCVLPNGKGKTEDTIAALKALLPIVKADPGHQYIVNMSMGGFNNPNSPLVVEEEAAINALVEAGVPVFVSAGNDGEKVLNKFPSCFQSPITVSAIDQNGKKCDFSTWHDEVDFCALGRGVRGLALDGSTMLKSGTSMACPNLAGAGGLLMSAFSLTEPQLYEKMKSLAIDLGTGGRDPYYGCGVVDIKTPSAIQPTKPEPPKVEPPKDATMKIYLSASTQEKNPCAPLPDIDCKTEETHCMEIMDAVAAQLKAHGFTVKRNRPEMDYASSYKEGNGFGADMYLCFHTNGSNDPAKRGAYWAYITQGGKNRKLADLLAKHTTMDGVTVRASDKTGASGFGELDLCTAKHAAYAELGYHSSPDDHAWLHRNMTAIVEGIVQAVCEYVGAAYKPVDPAPVEPEPKPLYPALYAFTGATYVNVRTGPGAKHDPIGKLSAGQKCIVLALENGWAEVILHELNPMVRGWCIDTYLRKV